MRILAAVDETAEGIESIRLAAELSLGPGHEVVAVCTTESRILSYGLGMGLGAAPGAFLVAPALASADPGADLATAVVAALGDTPCIRRIVVREEPPARAMAEAMAEADADLVILPGTVRRGRLEALLLGDPWGRLIADATVPVLLARPGRASPMTVFVVLDDPRIGADAIRALTRFPLPPEAQVLLLGLVPAGSLPGSVKRRQRMIRRTDVAVRMLRRAGIRTASLVRQGEHAADVLEAAEAVGADLIVVGRHPVARGRRLGGLVRGLTSTASCSVLLVPSAVRLRRRRWLDRDDADLPATALGPSTTPERVP